MEAILKGLLLASHGLFAYLSIFSVLVACGLGVPLPEDVSLILGGFLAHQGAVALPIMMGVGFCGILAGDSIIFFAGRRIGSQAGKSGSGFIARLVTPDKRKKVEGLFKVHGEKIVMLARFLPGVRAVTYFTAGSAGMRYTRFIMFDGCAALGSAPLFVYLGFRFGGHLERIIHGLREGQFVMVSTVVLLGVSFIAYQRTRAWLARRARPVQDASRASTTAVTALATAIAPALHADASVTLPPASKSPQNTPSAPPKQLSRASE